jgi:gamma-glutamyl hydrolase
MQYIAASYVKWIELAGGRVVPIPYNGTNDEMDKIFNNINGLLLPGGGAEVSAGATYIVKKAIQAVCCPWFECQADM